jgi:hypothetical protein
LEQTKQCVALNLYNFCPLRVSSQPYAGKPWTHDDSTKRFIGRLRSITAINFECICSLPDRRTDRQTPKQMERHADRHPETQTDTQTDPYVDISSHNASPSHLQILVKSVFLAFKKVVLGFNVKEYPPGPYGNPV